MKNKKILHVALLVAVLLLMDISIRALFVVVNNNNCEMIAFADTVNTKSDPSKESHLNSFETSSTVDWHNQRLVIATHGPRVFVHEFLPRGLPYKYIPFASPSELNKLLQKRYTEGTHFIIVADGDMRKIASIIQNFRSQHSPKNSTISFGLFHMSDELLTTWPTGAYSKFDYVLRHYYSHLEKRIPGLRALGNLTCGKNPASLPETGAKEKIKTTSHQPLLGVHWVHQWSAHVVGWNYPKWPMAQRSTGCSFIGRPVPEREKMKRIMEANATTRQMCDIHMTPGYKKGADKFEYQTFFLGDSKIVLNPTGNNVECIRLGEMTRLGTIPAMLDDAPYLHAAWAPLPGIYGPTWEDVAAKIYYFLQDEQEEELQQLSDAVFQWTEDYISCSRSDMSNILSRAFGNTR